MVQYLQALEQLKGNLPDECLLETFPIILLKSLIDLALQVASICVLHNHAETLCVVIEKRALVPDHVGHVD